MHTEDQARQMWCPQSRDFEWGSGVVTLKSDCCKASECMAWRWIENACEQKPGERRGFCGLAGKPGVEP